MSRRGTRFVGGLAAAVAVLTVGLDVLRAVDLRWQTTALVAALAGLAGLAAQRAIAIGQRRAEQEERERVLDDALGWWPPPLAQEADPFELGAFPANGGAYVERDADVDLRKALQDPGYLVVVGPAGSGKSRSAFEAVRQSVGLAKLLVPEDDESLGRLLATGQRPPRGEQGAVLWLDGLERFLGGLRLDAVDRWVDAGDLRVVATIEDGVLDALLASTGPERHIARRLLRRASVVEIDGTRRSGETDAVRETSSAAPFGIPEPVGPARRPRPDRWLSLALAGVAVAAALIVMLHFDRGLRAPAAMDRQIARLKLDLAGCSLETFAGDEENLPIVATVDAGRECEGHASGEDPVLVYDVRDDRLRPVFDFGPPRTGFPQDARFGCRGAAANPCWTDVTGHGDHAIIGVFRDPDTQSLMPVAVWRDSARGWRVDPLLTEPAKLPKRFRAKPYHEPVDLGGDREGYRVADVAVLPAREGDRSLPARAVVGFAPRSALLSPRKLQTKAMPLSFDSGAGVRVQDPCLVVQDGVHLTRLESRVGRGSLSDALRQRWEELEKAREGICVLNR